MHYIIPLLSFFYTLCIITPITLDRRLKHFEDLDVLEITEDDDNHHLSLNNRPIIGVLTQPSAWPKFFDTEDFSYIAASYVKFLEAAGARILPIKYNLNKTELSKIFQNINGLLLPGGGTDLFKLKDEKFENYTDYFEAGSFLLNLSKKTNENGEYFPVWGTCLGFEMMILSISGSPKTLSLFNSTNHSMKLKFLKSTLMSKLFSKMRQRMKYYLSHENFMYFNHRFGIDVKTFSENANLNSFFDVLTINNDKNGKSFVSSIEAKEYPFYGVQFHPEKNSFEWQEHLEINHSPGAIEIQLYFANFFVNEARKNIRGFNNSKEEKKELISNFYSLPISESFVNVYIFTKPTVKDLFKLNIHSKRFLGFIQNYKHANESSLNHTNNNSLNNLKNMEKNTIFIENVKNGSIFKENAKNHNNNEKMVTNETSFKNSTESEKYVEFNAKTYDNSSLNGINEKNRTEIMKIDRLNNTNNGTEN